MYQKVIKSCIIVALLVLQAAASFAQGTLMVNPKRIVFEGNKRNDVVTLFNSGDDTTSYAISYIHYEMLESGEFKTVDTIKTEVKFADNMVRFFPKEITLPPRSSQTIRLQFSKPKDLAPGEYRSHLYFRGVERARALESKQVDTTNKISISLRPIFGIAIPIIVRTQTSPAKVNLSDFSVTPPDTANVRMANFHINRTGDESCYGQLILKYKSPDGKVSELSLSKGVGVYVPLPTRTFQMPFTPPEGVKIVQGGTYQLQYLTMTGGEKETALGELEMPVK